MVGFRVRLAGDSVFVMVIRLGVLAGIVRVVTWAC